MISEICGLRARWHSMEDKEIMQTIETNKAQKKIPLFFRARLRLRSPKTLNTNKEKKWALPIITSDYQLTSEC